MNNDSNTGRGGHGGERGGGPCVCVIHASGGREVPGHVAHTRHLREDGVVDLSFHLRGLHCGHQKGAGLLALRRFAEGVLLCRAVPSSHVAGCLFVGERFAKILGV